MNQEILFSVVIPTYNRGERLKVALASVLNQTYSKFEVIVVDDGGADNSRLIAESFGDKRIKYFWKPNQERSIARNYGVKCSTGEYVCFLDSDDYWLPNHLEIGYNFLYHNRSNAFHSSFQYCADNGDVLKKVILKESVKLNALLVHNFLHANAVFVKRSVLSDINFIPSRKAILSEDWYLWIRLIVRNDFFTSTSVTAVVVEHENRSLNNIDPLRCFQSNYLVNRYLQDDSLFMVYKGRNKFFSLNMVFSALVFAVNGEKKMSLLCLKRALIYNPSIVLHKRFLAVVRILAMK